MNERPATIHKHNSRISKNAYVVNFNLNYEKISKNRILYTQQAQTYINA